jgi:hypothetical protein
MLQRPRGSEEPGCLAWAGSSENKTAPWGLLNPRGPRRVAPQRTLACAQSCRRPWPTSPLRLPQVSRSIAEVTRHYPQRRRRVEEDAGILPALLSRAQTSGGRMNLWCPQGSPGYLLGKASGSVPATISARELPRHMSRRDRLQRWTLRGEVLGKNEHS